MKCHIASRDMTRDATLVVLIRRPLRAPMGAAQSSFGLGKGLCSVAVGSGVTVGAGSGCFWSGF